MGSRRTSSPTVWTSWGGEGCLCEGDASTPTAWEGGSVAALRACCSWWAGPGVGLCPGTQRIEMGEGGALGWAMGTRSKHAQGFKMASIRSGATGRPDVSHSGIFGFC